MNRPRVVIDTNVVVSAAVKRDGLEQRIIELVATRDVIFCASAAVFAEYETVLARPKFGHIERGRISRLLTTLKAEATMVTPDHRVDVSPDEPDNRLLECAEAAGADYLVTGNKRHFPKRWKSTRIVNAREYLRRGSLSDAE
jgi:uncharacterized protein